MKYQNIARLILKEIEAKQMVQGDKLPSLETLMTTYKAGKNTIINAISVLESAGVVYQVRGSGIYVRGHRRKGYINLLELEGFNSLLREFKLSSKVIEVKVMKPSEEVCTNLKIEPDEDVYYVKRLRYIEGQVLCIEESYYKKSVVPYLNEDIANHSIFQFITKDLGLEPGFVDTFLRVIKLSEEEAELLTLDNGDPGILVESIYHLKNFETFDYSKIIYHYNEAQFFTQANSYYTLMD